MDKRPQLIQQDEPLPVPPKAPPRARANGKHDGATSTETDGAADEANGKAQETNGSGSVIRVVAGELPRIVDEAQQALMDRGLPIFARGGLLVHPIQEAVPAPDGRKTMSVRLRTVAPDLMTRWLAEAASFVRYDMRRDRHRSAKAGQHLPARGLRGDQSGTARRRVPPC
jgi:hypothetical protein